MKKTYLSYSDITVKAFYKISEENNLNWFVKKWDGVSKSELKDEDLIELAKRYKQIFLDRINYLEDTSISEYYRKLNEVEILKMKVYRLANTLTTLNDIPLKNEYFEKFVQDLKEEGLKFGKPVKTEAERKSYLKLMDSKVKGWKTKLSVLKLEYKSVLEPKEKRKQDLVKEMIMLQEIHPNQRIDIDKMNLKHWDGLVRLAQEKAVESEKQMAKIKR